MEMERRRSGSCSVSLSLMVSSHINTTYLDQTSEIYYYTHNKILHLEDKIWQQIHIKGHVKERKTSTSLAQLWLFHHLCSKPEHETFLSEYKIWIISDVLTDTVKCPLPIMSCRKKSVQVERGAAVSLSWRSGKIWTEASAT